MSISSQVNLPEPGVDPGQHGIMIGLAARAAPEVGMPHPLDSSSNSSSSSSSGSGAVPAVAGKTAVGVAAGTGDNAKPINDGKDGGEEKPEAAAHFPTVYGIAESAATLDDSGRKHLGRLRDAPLNSVLSNARADITAAYIVDSIVLPTMYTDGRNGPSIAPSATLLGTIERHGQYTAGRGFNQEAAKSQGAANDSMNFVANITASFEAGTGTDMTAIVYRVMMMATHGVGFLVMEDPNYFANFRVAQHLAFLQGTVQALPMWSAFQGKPEIAANCLSVEAFSGTGMFTTQVPEVLASNYAAHTLWLLAAASSPRGRIFQWASTSFIPIRAMTPPPNALWRTECDTLLEFLMGACTVTEFSTARSACLENTGLGVDFAMNGGANAGRDRRLYMTPMRRVVLPGDRLDVDVEHAYNVRNVYHHLRAEMDMVKCTIRVRVGVDVPAQIDRGGGLPDIPAQLFDFPPGAANIPETMGDVLHSLAHGEAWTAEPRIAVQIPAIWTEIILGVEGAAGNIGDVCRLGGVRNWQGVALAARGGVDRLSLSGPSPAGMYGRLTSGSLYTGVMEARPCSTTSAQYTDLIVLAYLSTQMTYAENGLDGFTSMFNWVDTAPVGSRQALDMQMHGQAWQRSAAKTIFGPAHVGRVTEMPTNVRIRIERRTVPRPVGMFGDDGLLPFLVATVTPVGASYEAFGRSEYGKSFQTSSAVVVELFSRPAGGEVTKMGGPFWARTDTIAETREVRVESGGVRNLGEMRMVGVRNPPRDRTNTIVPSATIMSSFVCVSHAYMTRGPQLNWGFDNFQGAAAVQHATAADLSEGLHPRLPVFRRI
jgi:hypothetical protein